MRWRFCGVLRRMPHLLPVVRSAPAVSPGPAPSTLSAGSLKATPDPLPTTKALSCAALQAYNMDLVPLLGDDAARPLDPRGHFEFFAMKEIRGRPTPHGGAPACPSGVSTHVASID
ncbi:hypothetical protein FB451DRAFT_1228570 [Mycena latifolia]|nr:hypothetical protein FB451DRAFT_1228570 [Mycena latifolia]